MTGKGFKLGNIFIRPQDDTTEGYSPPPPLAISRDAGLAFFFLRDLGLPPYSARDTGFNLSAVSGFEKKIKRDTGFGLYPLRDSGLKNFHATICYALFLQNGSK